MDAPVARRLAGGAAKELGRPGHAADLGRDQVMDQGAGGVTEAMILYRDEVGNLLAGQRRLGHADLVHAHVRDGVHLGAVGGGVIGVVRVVDVTVDKGVVPQRRASGHPRRHRHVNPHPHLLARSQSAEVAGNRIQRLIDRAVSRPLALAVPVPGALILDA